MTLGMPPEPLTKLEELLVAGEGLKLHPYEDTQGKVTIGIGRNLTTCGISKEEAFQLLRNDVVQASSAAERYPWFAGLCSARQDAIVSMLFNLGPTRFSGFAHMILDLSTGDFDSAALEMIASEWANQIGARAHVLSEMIRTGEYPT